MASQLIINPAALAEALIGPTGPVARKMIVVGEAAKLDAIARLKPGFPRDAIGPTILKRIVQTPLGVAVQVGTNFTKTLEHTIPGSPLLHFHWLRMGTTVTVHSVHHPGSDFTSPTPNHPKGYIQETLEAALSNVVVV